MGLLDLLVDRSFRNDPASGRVVIVNASRPPRGFLVRSASDEPKIRSFLKMFLIAQVSIQGLGTFLTILWITQVNASSATPYSLRTRALKLGLFYLIAYGAIVVLPIVFLQRAYKKGLSSFFTPEDEVPISAAADRRSWIAVAAVLAFALLALIAILALIRAK